jgi:hypothetical protein
VQHQRSALLLNAGILYVAYGAHTGDCGVYHGWVIAVPVNGPTRATAWVTEARGGGIWAPGGLATDGTSIFAATGNTFGASAWREVRRSYAWALEQFFRACLWTILRPPTGLYWMPPTRTWAARARWAGARRAGRHAIAAGARSRQEWSSVCARSHSLRRPRDR